MYSNATPIEVNAQVYANEPRRYKLEILRQMREEIKNKLFETVLQSPAPIMVYGYEENYLIHNDVMNYGENIVTQMRVRLYLENAHRVETQHQGYAGNYPYQVFHFELLIPDHELHRWQMERDMNRRVEGIPAMGMRSGRPMEEQIESIDWTK